MKKIYHVMNQYNYYMSNIIFNIINIVLVIFLYNFGFFGEQTEHSAFLLQYLLHAQ